LGSILLLLTRFVAAALLIVTILILTVRLIALLQPLGCAVLLT
jgi:hypothetical protein